MIIIVNWRTQLFRPKVYQIEIHDKSINRDIGKLLVETSRIIKDFISSLEREDIPGKEEYSRQLYEVLLNLKSKTMRLEHDISSIINIELQKKRYVSIHDDKFINDKNYQLTLMQEQLDNMLEILREAPSNKTYREGLLNVLLSNLNTFYRTLEKIRRDDSALSKIYSELSDM